MKTLLKSAIAVAALAGAAATMLPSAATAGVSVSVSLGDGYGIGYSAYDNNYYYDPIYFGGAWYHGPYRWRMHHGHRAYFVNGSWHQDEWRGARPQAISFRNGGYFRNGQNGGFSEANRINARFHTDAHQGRRDDRSEARREDRHDERHDNSGDNNGRHGKNHDKHHGDHSRN